MDASKLPALDAARLVGLEHARRAATSRTRRRTQAEVGRLLAAVEAEVAADPGACFAFDADGRATLTTREGTWAAGRFSTPTLGELEARVRALARREGAQVTLSVLLGADVLTDVGTLQATSDGAALFQVASQFNALEATGPEVALVQHYLLDSTQGPRASVSAFPGTFLRHYRAPRRDGTRFVQGPGEGLDLLGDVLGPGVARVEHGYLRAQGILDPRAALAALEGHLDAVRIGLHEDVEVVLGHDWAGPVDGAPRIAQAFTSTIALGGYSASAAATPELPAITRQLLRAAYLGTLLGALAAGRARAVLTLIGGGVFGNPHRTIWDALLWAVGRVAALAPAPLDVVVNSRDLASHVERGELLAAVRARGGVLTEVRGDGLTITR